MADTKVSERPVATSVSDSDLLYLVQNVTSKRVTVGTLFENLNIKKEKKGKYDDSESDDEPK